MQFAYFSDQSPRVPRETNPKAYLCFKRVALAGSARAVSIVWGTDYYGGLCLVSLQLVGLFVCLF